MAKKQRRTTKRFPKPQAMTAEEISQFIVNFREASRQVKAKRMSRNKKNTQQYNLEHDFSHKKDDQNKEVLSDLAMAAEEFSSFIQQSLMTQSNRWVDIEPQLGVKQENLKIKTSDVKKIVFEQLKHAKIYSHVLKGMKLGYLGGVVVSKVGGQIHTMPKFRAEQDKNQEKDSKGRIKMRAVADDEKVWRLHLGLIRHKDYYPDPNAVDGKKMRGECEDMEMDLSEVISLSKGEDAIYDPDVVKNLAGNEPTSQTDQSGENREQVNEHTPSTQTYARVKITEFWGDIEDNHGNILYENVVCTIAEDKYLIQPPIPNPLWHNESPYVIGALQEQAFTRWPKAIADAPAEHNEAMTELFNLLLDGAMASAQNVKIVVDDLLRDPETQIGNGIKDGATLRANMKALSNIQNVMTTVKTGEVPRDAMQMMDKLSHQFYRAAQTNAAREQALQQTKGISATAIVEGGNKIQSVYTGIVNAIEESWLTEIVRKSTITTAQNMDSIWAEEIKSIIEPGVYEQLQALTPAEIFAEIVNGMKFKVTAISALVRRGEDFRKWTTLLELISGNPELRQFFAEEFSIKQLLSVILESLNIDIDKIRLSSEELQAQEAQRQQTLNPGQPQGNPIAGPNTQSQQPQSASMAGRFLGSRLAQSSFPSGGNN